MEMRYSLDVAGFNAGVPDRVKEDFEAHSVLKKHQGEPLLSVANLRARVNQDVDLLRRILRAEGYYDSVIRQRISRRNNRFEVQIHFDPGPRYVLADIRIVYEGKAPPADVHRNAYDRLNLSPGEPLRAEAVSAAQTYLYLAYPERGYPQARVTDREIIVDHATRQATVTYRVNPGPLVRLGPARFQGAPHVRENYLYRFVTWSRGDIYDQRQLDQFRRRLYKTGLFRSIHIEPDPQAIGEERPVLVRLQQAEHRTLSVAAGYATDEGASGDLSWEHRNWRGWGERLFFGAHLAEIEQSLKGRLEKPNHHRLDQTLSFETELARENTDAFEAHTIEARAALERVLNDRIAVSAAAELQYSDVTETTTDRKFLLASLPLGVRWDSSNDLLNPVRGLRASLIIAPSLIRNGGTFSYLRSEVMLSGYYPLARDGGLVLAGRARLGAIVGIDELSLPANERFYTGGGGSVRGYGFQGIGPQDNEGDPLGGRSVAELGGELRWRLSRTIGIVPFLEGGNVYEDNLPQFKGFRWGAGLGLRYYTGFGPIRLDVATPLDRRDGESRIQLYVSLGQAF